MRKFEKLLWSATCLTSNTSRVSIDRTFSNLVQWLSFRHLVCFLEILLSLYSCFLHLLWCKLAFFKSAWQKVKVLSRPWSIVQLWPLVFLEPLGVQWPYVPHFKGLIGAKVDLEAQGRDSTFTFCHAHLKKAILHHRRCKKRFVFSTTVQYL